jgi:hypothetical protein
MNLDAAAVDEQLRGYPLDTGQIGEDALPHPLVGPAPEAVVEGLLRPVDMFRAVAPPATALQRMNYPRQHSTVIDPSNPARVAGQKRLDPRLLLIRKPEEIRHPSRLLAEER